jgi:hypothetical protein
MSEKPKVPPPRGQCGKPAVVEVGSGALLCVDCNWRCVQSESNPAPGAFPVKQGKNRGKSQKTARNEPRMVRKSLILLIKI